MDPILEEIYARFDIIEHRIGRIELVDAVVRFNKLNPESKPESEPKLDLDAERMPRSEPESE